MPDFCRAYDFDCVAGLQDAAPKVLDLLPAGQILQESPKAFLHFALTLATDVVQQKTNQTLMDGWVVVELGVDKGRWQRRRQGAPTRARGFVEEERRIENHAGQNDVVEPSLLGKKREVLLRSIGKKMGTKSA